MAGDGDGQAVGSAGGGDGAGGFGGAEGFGDLGVAGGFAGGDGAQSGPDALLEGGAANVQREIGFGGGAFDEGDDVAEEGCVRRFDSGVGELAGEVGLEGGGVVAEGDGADARCGGGDEDVAEGAGGGGDADVLARGAFAVGGGGHAELDCGVETGAGFVPGTVDGFGDRARGGEGFEGFFSAQGGGVGFWGDAGDGFEEAVEMEGAAPCFSREDGEGGCGCRRGDAAAGGGDEGGLFVLFGRAVWPAAFAGAVAGGLGGGGGWVEFDVFGQRRAGGAMRPAIDAGGFDGVEEDAVRAGVPGGEGLGEGGVDVHGCTLSNYGMARNLRRDGV